MIEIFTGGDDGPREGLLDQARSEGRFPREGDPRSGLEGYIGLAWQRGCDIWKVQRYGGEQKGVQFRQLPMTRIHGDQYAGAGGGWHNSGA